MKIRWKYKVTNADVSRKMKHEESLHVANNNGHVLTGSNVLLLLEGKVEGKKERVGLKGHGLVNCCNGHRETSIMM